MQRVVKVEKFFFSCHASLRKKSHDVRVRFAPSPTGSLHLGGIRTAWLNYLFAKQREGKFVLRIEDTDQSRVVKEVANDFERILNWLEIEPDESPMKGGPFGPYVQSSRLEHYQKYVDRLIDSSSAYRCFCSENRLALLRKQALKNRQVPRYDNKCREMSTLETQEKLGNTQPHCVRFKYDPPSDKAFHDLIQGSTPLDIAEHEGDFVLLKADGFPTYHLANVVDDLLMNISHVLRGMEWIISTPKHLLLYRALGEEPPQYGHFPLLINSDGTKLSKRQSSLHIKTLKEEGIYPLALLSFLSRLGGGFPHSHGLQTDPSYFVRNFNFKSIGKTPAKIQFDLLYHHNKEYLRTQYQVSEENKKELLDQLVKLLLTKYPSLGIKNGQLQVYGKKVLDWAVGRVNTLNELLDDQYTYLWLDQVEEDAGPKLKELKHVIGPMAELVCNLAPEQFTWEQFQKVAKEYSNTNRCNYGQLIQLLRMCLTGQLKGPSMAELFSLFDRDRVMHKLDQVMNYIEAGK